MLLQLVKGVFDRVLEGLLQLVACFFDVVQPFFLDLGTFAVEQLAVHLFKLVSDFLEAVLENLLGSLHRRFLIGNERVQLVDLLANVDQVLILDPGNFLLNAAVLGLEEFDLSLLHSALSATVNHESILVGRPLMLAEARVVHLIEICDVLVEQLSLSVVDQDDDVVVIAHDEHYVLAEHTKAFRV